jgi:hypothetical protein
VDVQELAHLARLQRLDSDRSFDVVVTVEQRDDAAMTYRPRGVVIYEVFLPPARAAAPGLRDDFEALFHECLADATRRRKSPLAGLGMPGPAGGTA